MGEDGVSLAAHYAEISRYFWISVSITYVIFIVYGMYTLGLAATLGQYFSPAAQLLMMIVLIAFPRRSIHAVLVRYLSPLLLRPSDQPDVRLGARVGGKEPVARRTCGQ